MRHPAGGPRRPIGRILLAFGLCLLGGRISHAQVVLTDDASVNSAEPQSNYGSKVSLPVGPRQRAFLRFDLSHLPAGLTADDVPNATLILWVGEVSTSGSIGLYRVADGWDERFLTHATAPPLGAAEGARVTIGNAQKNRFLAAGIHVLVTMTPLWRFNSIAYVTVWTPSQIVVIP